MIKVLCSSGALITRFNGRDPNLLREFFPRLHAWGIEFMVYPSWDGMLTERIRDVRAIQRDLGMPIPVLHADKRIGELLSQGSFDEIEEAKARFQTCCQAAFELGAELMVLHLWGGTASDKHIGRNIEVLSELMEMAKLYGITLTVENVVCAESTPLTHIKTIMERYPEALFTIDTKMAEFHRELPQTLACDELWNGRVRHLHVNDYGGGIKDFSDLSVLHMGDGHVDFAPFFDKVKASGYEGYATVESTSVNPDGSVDFAKLNATLDKLSKSLK